MRGQYDEVRDELGKLAAKLLADGEWHDREPIVQALMKLIPPGVAMRQSEVVRTRGGRASRTAVRLHQRTTRELIDSGARDFVRLFLKPNTSGKGAFEYDREFEGGRRASGVVDDRRIRMKYPPIGARNAERMLPEQEIERLRDQIALLRAELIGLGKGARADEIAPLPPSEVDD